MYEVYLCIHMVKVLACCRTGGIHHLAVPSSVCSRYVTGLNFWEDAEDSSVSSLNCDR